MRISVVIPVLEDRLELRSQVARLGAVDELIVVDASSIDPIQPSDLPEEAVLISSVHANRAYQQNLGATAATGEVLLFLHADTRLPAGAMQNLRNTIADKAVVGGGFERFFDSPSLFLKCTCQLAILRAHTLGLFLGDQALFVRRDVFWEVGGFAQLRVFEDYDLCRKLRKRGGLRCLNPPVISSARRFTRGAVLRSLNDFLLTLRYFVGGSRPFEAIDIEEINEGLEPPTP